MFGRRRFLEGTAGLGATFTFGCSGGGGGGNANEWVVGAYLSLTGEQSKFGEDTKRGIELAVEEINANPPKGKKIKVLFEDDKSKVEEATQKAQQLIDRDKVVALLGEIASSISKPVAIIANQKKVPMITPSSTHPDVTKTGDFAFRVCFTDDFQGKAGADFCVKSLGKKKVGLMYAENDLYSQGLAAEFKKAVGPVGGEVVIEKKFTDTETNFTTYIKEVKDAGVEVIYCPIYYNQMTPLWRQAKAEGLTGEMFVGGDGWSGDDTLLKELEGGYFTDHYAPDVPWAQGKKFVESFKKKFNQTPSSLAACGYDAAMVLADAIKRAKEDTAKGIRDAIAETKDYAGATGSISINKDRNADKAIVFVQIKGGTTTYKAAVGPGAEKLTEGAAPAPASAAPSASAAPEASASAATSASAAPSASAAAAPSAAPAAGSANPGKL
ncbi:MAG: ABC transporter substrate-binding protein [Myxococcales bacterium]|nr:ABC transporter substrate-binding protein [Myxococcales bacterium]